MEMYRRPEVEEKVSRDGLYHLRELIMMST